MTRSLHSRGGGRVYLRLSDIPEKIRLRAAERVTNREIKNAPDPVKALIVSRDLHTVATDPARAAETIPDECSNRLFSVSAEEYEAALRRFGYRRNGN